MRARLCPSFTWVKRPCRHAQAPTRDYRRIGPGIKLGLMEQACGCSVVRSDRASLWLPHDADRLKDTWCVIVRSAAGTSARH